ncbi:MAG: ROK family transcriptional regulator [Prolixibacteraceae bacterium]|jgi:N-acetylglucosamine repressor|nr:ROK family transcriptional regulator [Prolixibacteraceae bacterium]MBT6765153.1 ROK family transcriptional regulator [Prolixibacteraceae bacterium]MBT6999972.1 ROK family transcriptional regulator [Prolixibacteraceae bacterium]MBT7395537.1 ROK family transcriptional regulator [Prolixibacteraceae bacterium]
MIVFKNIGEGNLSGNELKKYRQKKKILQLLYKCDSLSGSVLSKRLGVSLPTALSLLNDLSKLNLVEQRGTGVSKGGRKPTMFGLSHNSIYVVACELGRYKGKITIYNVHNQPVTPILYFETSIDDDNLVEKIYTNTQKLIRKNKIRKELIFGVGLNMPGLVDEVNGINHTIKNEEFRNIKERLEKKFSKLVYINNDARMQAYGEYIFGGAKGHPNAIIVTWSWGIGLGMILDGKLYNGSTGFAGELSHAKFAEDGDLCICGKRGCLETIASVNVLMKNTKDGIKAGKISQLTEKFKNRIDKLQPTDIIAAAKSGDELSISVLNKVGLELGKGLSFTIQLLNPDIIVLGGIISDAKQFVLTPIQQSLNKYCLELISSNTKIVISENWEQSGLLGIAAMLYQKIFSDMHK